MLLIVIARVRQKREDLWRAVRPVLVPESGTGFDLRRHPGLPNFSDHVTAGRC